MLEIAECNVEAFEGDSLMPTTDARRSMQLVRGFLHTKKSAEYRP